MRAAKFLELEAAVAVARRGSFRAAASDLAISPTAVGNAVAALEAELGVRLFDRTTRRVVLTAAGHDFISAIAPALSDIHAATDAARSRTGSPVGTLRINCSIAGGHQILAPFITEFVDRYPRIKVDLVTEGRLVDIVSAGFDAGVRIASAVPPNMAVIALNQRLRHIVVGAPAYFENHPHPMLPSDLLAHSCIRIRYPSGAPYLWEFEKDGEVMCVDVPGSLSLDNHGLMERAAMAGIGLAYVSEAEVRENIDSGRLVPVLDDWMPFDPGFCFYYPEHGRASRVVDLFAELIKERTTEAG